MPEPLWKPAPERIERANMTRFIHFVNDRQGTDFQDYAALYQWSINSRAEFWSAMWDFGGIKSSQPAGQTLVDGDKMPGAKWFVGSELNFAENLLRYNDDKTALVFLQRGGPQPQPDLCPSSTLRCGVWPPPCGPLAYKRATGWLASSPTCPRP